MSQAPDADPWKQNPTGTSRLAQADWHNRTAACVAPMSDCSSLVAQVYLCWSGCSSLLTPTMGCRNWTWTHRPGPVELDSDPWNWTQTSKPRPRPLGPDPDKQMQTGATRLTQPDNRLVLCESGCTGLVTLVWLHWFGFSGPVALLWLYLSGCFYLYGCSSVVMPNFVSQELNPWAQVWFPFSGSGFVGLGLGPVATRPTQMTQHADQHNRTSLWYI